MITHGYLLSRLSYDKDTGAFLWLECSARRKSWNTRFAGKQAGTKNADGYVVIHIDGTDYLAHRLAVFYVTGELPSDKVDHINGRTSDNAWTNLRCATNQQNGFNAGLSKANKSGHKGVCWAKKNQKWMASIMVDGKSKFLGYYEDLSDAVEARKRAETEMFGSFARVTT